MGGRTGRRGRGGFTLIEMMLSVLLLVVVFGVSVAFFRAQTRAVDAGAGRLDALQSARFALQQVERELRLAGGVRGQPVIVMASPFALTFNANVRAATADRDAAQVDAGFDPLAVEGFLVSRARALPLVQRVYPVVDYRDVDGDTTRAETISYFARPDTVTGRPDLYVLYRRANDRDSTVVTRNLQVPADTGYVFAYQRITPTGALAAIEPSALPLYWDDATGWADSIRAVDLRLSGIYRDRRTDTDVVRTINARVAVPNGGRLTVTGCGAAPAAPTGLSVTPDTLYMSSHLYGSGEVARTGNRLAWTGSTDDNGAPHDVVSYVVYRRPGAGTWIPVGQVPARRLTASYRFDDVGLDSGTVQYAVAAVDCGGAASPLLTGTNVVMP